MVKMKSRTNDLSVHEEYKTVLTSLKPLIANLSSTEEAKMCLLWLSKLDEASPDEFLLRNELLKKLSNQIKSGHLKVPFIFRPSVSRLEAVENIDADSETVVESELPSYREEVFCNCCLHYPVMLPDNSIIKSYEERAKRAQAKINKYQKILKNLSALNNADLGKLRPQRSGKPLFTNESLIVNPSYSFRNVPSDQSLRKVVPLLPNANTEIIIETLPPVTRGQLTEQGVCTKCDCLASGQKSEKISNNAATKDQVGEYKSSFNNPERECEEKIQKMIKKFREEMEKMAKEKDETLATLEEQLYETTMNLTKSQLTDFDQALKTKCDELEQKYRKIVDNLEKKL